MDQRCNSFKYTLFKGKQCYFIDVNEILDKHKIIIIPGASNGLSFLVDNNFNRHFGRLASSKIAKKQIESGFGGLEKDGKNDKKGQNIH